MTFRNKNEHKFYYNLFKSNKGNEYIHNLTDISIPDKFKCILSLGLKYCTPDNLSQRALQTHVTEAARKIAWRVYFNKHPSPDDKTEYDNWYISCKKVSQKNNKQDSVHFEFEHEIVDVNHIYKTLYNQLVTQEAPHSLKIIISDLKAFCILHNILIIEADKNAGICIVKKEDYETEVLRQLNDLNTYHPSTKSQFNLSMIEFRDKLKRFDKSINSKKKISYLLSSEDNPANFRILPKIHKPFEHFPKGRPISSTSSKFNKFASKLLDFELKPCLADIKDLLIDTQHFLLLINEVKLDPKRKYAFVTVDIESLYTNLDVKDCRKHCVNAYLNCDNHVGLKLNEQQINSLISLSLCYNYVKYEDNWFIQHRGIEMGNAASVMVANITVYNEIHSLFDTHSEITFYKRFLDDIFLIVDITDMSDLSQWLNDTLKHNYLKFTWETSEESINFLDVTVKKHDNIIQTELYSKPMSKHLYLHSTSSHPVHLKNSLYFSQGLRIIKICSEYSYRLQSLMSLFLKFKNRWYDDKVLYNTFLKLICTKREDILKPKNKMLVRYLQANEPQILARYGHVDYTRTFNNKTNDTVLVFPFIPHISKYKQKLKNTISQSIIQNVSGKWKKYILDLNIQIVFSRTKNMKEMLKEK